MASARQFASVYLNFSQRTPVLAGGFQDERAVAEHLALEAPLEAHVSDLEAPQWSRLAAKCARLESVRKGHSLPVSMMYWRIGDNYAVFASKVGAPTNPD